MADSQTYKRAGAKLAEFRDLLVQYANLHDSGQDFLGQTVWAPKEGAQYRLGDLRGQLNRLVQAAGHAQQLSGRLVEWKPAGTWQTQTINPIPGWAEAFTAHDPPVRLGVLLDVIDQGLGALDHLAAEAEAREGTVTAKLGKVIGYPDRVRSAAGRPRRLPAPTGQFWTGLASGVAAAVIADVIAKAAGLA